MADEPPPPPLEDFSGRVLGDFELVRRVGVGGMGQVYLARQLSLKRQVAVKILKAELAANEAALRRFRAEAEAVAHVTHAHIVQVYAIGSDQGLHFMALEYVDGCNLRDHLERKGVPDLAEAVEIMRQVASALERAGELGFVHRDIKPENILLSKKREVKVTDFGLSRAFAGDTDVALTQTGMTMGTPLYMSPEQVRGQPVDPRTDIYSFGVTCYHLLAGEPPYRGATAFDIALQHVQGEPMPLSALRPDLPPALSAIVHRMMAKRPEARYQSAREILTDLSRLKEGLGPTPTVGLSSMQMPLPVPPQRSAGWRYAVVGLLAIAAAAGGAALNRARQPQPTPAINPDDALADVDPTPGALREKELRRKIADRDIKFEVVVNDLLELALWCVADRRPDEALRLFGDDAVRKLPAFATKSKEPSATATIVAGLGRGIVLAHLDKPDESTAHFTQLATLTAKTPTPLDALLLRAGPEWRRAIGEALERNARNKGNKVPDDLRRLLVMPGKKK